MSTISQQLKYLDVTCKVDENMQPAIHDDEEDTGRFRLYGKRPPEELFQPPIPELDESTVERLPHDGIPEDLERALPDEPQEKK